MISAVVVTYDSAACVGRCIASVQDALPHAEIVVVDNRSHDETVNAIRAAAPEARVIENHKNIGFGRACNTSRGGARIPCALRQPTRRRCHSCSPTAAPQLLATRLFGLVAPELEGEVDRRRTKTHGHGELCAHARGVRLANGSA
jgi:Glycosyl transferase family 2